MQKNLIVQVKVYKGPVNFNEGGQLTSPAQLIKLRYGVREWTLFLKGIVQMGWTRVDVIKCLDGNERTFDEETRIANHPEVDDAEIVKTIEAEIKKAMAGEEKQLTPEQQEIKELKAQMAKLLGTKQDAPKDDSKKSEGTDQELTAARIKYEEVFGKKPHHKSSVENINEAIKEKLNENKGE